MSQGRWIVTSGACHSIIIATVFAFPSHAACADPPVDWKAHGLPPAEEQRWIEAVKNHRTRDGTTVMEVLRHAEQMRPQRFKLAAIEVGYNGASSEPDAVMISYFIGMKRLDGDSYSIVYAITRSGKEIQLNVPKYSATGDSDLDALEGGRDSFLLKMDAFYKETCIDPDTYAELC